MTVWIERIFNHIWFVTFFCTIKCNIFQFQFHEFHLCTFHPIAGFANDEKKPWLSKLIGSSLIWCLPYNLMPLSANLFLTSVSKSFWPLSPFPSTSWYTSHNLFYYNRSIIDCHFYLLKNHSHFLGTSAWIVQYVELLISPRGQWLKLPKM